MKKKTIKQIALAAASLLLVATTVLAVHIYQVTRPGKADASTIAMARIDFKENLSKEDSVKITSWLYKQKGVEYVLCNPTSKIAVFSFKPIVASANDLAQNLASELNYTAERFLPSEEALKAGCPVK